ncbi:MAG TPA: sulfatase, partial [Gemmatimonadaceae bacterium]|nr:sulfatase [Gemmatimonadaceae bacterium]
ILDTVRAASLSLYGYAQPTTPKLARWAARGVVFEQAMAPAPWTLPSHGTLFTGRWPHELSAGWLTPLDGRWPTLAERFAARGYRTAGFVANHFYTTHESGLERGFLRYEDFRHSLPQLVLSSAIGQTVVAMHDAASAVGSRRDIPAAAWHALRPPPERLADRKAAPVVREEFEEWLEEQPTDRPFFAFLNYFDAHKPYEAPAEFRRRITGPGESRRAYDASIAYLDDEVSRLLGDLARSGELRNTLVVITSDHGELFGAHGLTGHGNSLYLPLLRVPLVMMMPSRVPAGVRVDTAVTLRDLAATIVDLAGLGGSPPVPGKSLARFWGGTASDAAPSPLLSEVEKGINTPPEHPVSRGDMRSLITMPWHYIRNGDGREELYDIVSDPAERRDLSGSEDARAALLRSREAVDTLLHARERALAEHGS